MSESRMMRYRIPIRSDGTIAEMDAPVPMSKGDIHALRMWINWYEEFVLALTPAPEEGG
jgi:hypothetical protein